MKISSYSSHDLKMMIFYLGHAVLIFTKVNSLATFVWWIPHQFFMQFLQRDVFFVTTSLLPWTKEQFRNRIYSNRKELASKGAN